MGTILKRSQRGSPGNLEGSIESIVINGQDSHSFLMEWAKNPKIHMELRKSPNR